ncbi:MAG: IPTL-CTERM sorting domain-containing protein [Usitatibacter sp.]
MKWWRVLLAAAAVASGFAAAPAGAQNLVLNPSFETGDTTSWTATGTCPFDVLSPPALSTGAAGFSAPAPAQGTFVLVSDALAPGVCELYQDIALPAGQTFTLSFASGYNFVDLGGDPTGAGCSATVGLSDTVGVPIATFYSRSGGFNQNINTRGPFNLPAGLAGTTVRVIITTLSCPGGPAGIEADNFVLAAGFTTNNVPTTSEWTLLLLATLMAVAALVAMHKRPPAQPRGSSQ